MRYTSQTRLRPGQVLARARAYFGPDGLLGLEITEHRPGRLTFTGGGGHVVIAVHQAGGVTRLEMEVWQYDAEARRFLGSLPGPSGRLRTIWETWRGRRRA